MMSKAAERKYDPWLVEATMTRLMLEQSLLNMRYTELVNKYAELEAAYKKLLQENANSQEASEGT